MGSPSSRTSRASEADRLADERAPQTRPVSAGHVLAVVFLTGGLAAAALQPAARPFMPQMIASANAAEGLGEEDGERDGPFR